jgi:hypothetical protein
LAISPPASIQESAADAGASAAGHALVVVGASATTMSVAASMSYVGPIFQIAIAPALTVPLNGTKATSQSADQWFAALARGITDLEDVFSRSLGSQLTAPPAVQDNADTMSWDRADQVTPRAGVEGAALDQCFAWMADNTSAVEDE